MYDKDMNVYYDHENDENESDDLEVNSKSLFSNLFENDTTIINYLSIQSSRYSNKKSTPLSDNYNLSEADEKHDFSKVKSNVIPSTKLNYDLLEELCDEFHNGYKNWRNMCFFMKNLNYPYEDFLRLSKGPTFVSDMKCFSQWNSTRIKKELTRLIFIVD